MWWLINRTRQKNSFVPKFIISHYSILMRALKNYSSLSPRHILRGKLLSHFFPPHAYILLYMDTYDNVRYWHTSPLICAYLQITVWLWNEVINYSKGLNLTNSESNQCHACKMRRSSAVFIWPPADEPRIRSVFAERYAKMRREKNDKQMNFYLTISQKR